MLCAQAKKINIKYYSFINEANRFKTEIQVDEEQVGHNSRNAATKKPKKESTCRRPNAGMMKK